MKNIAILLLITIIGISNAFATEVVKLSQGETQFVELSNRDLNVILFPDPVKVMTQSDLLEIKVEGQRIFISFKKAMDSEVIPVTPQQIYFLTKDRTYSMVAVPKGIPAVTVMVQTEGDFTEDEALKWEQEHPYIATIKGLIKAMYSNKLPPGYSITNDGGGVDVSRWDGLARVMSKKYVGAALGGEIYTLHNRSADVMRPKEQEFYEKGIIAVSIDSHELQPDEKTSLYLVKKLIVTDDEDSGTFDVLSQ
jgi:conjugal transfer pilus assembly protein TraK